MDPRQNVGRPSLGSLADEIWLLLLQLAFERVHCQIGVVAAELNLAPTQAMALRNLEAGRPISMRELANRLRCHPSNITGVIDRLEARGLVERLPDSVDRRVKGLALTPKGAQLSQTLDARICDPPPCVRQMDENDLRKLHALLVRILEDGG